MARVPGASPLVRLSTASNVSSSSNLAAFPGRLHQSFGEAGHPLQEFVERMTHNMLHPPGSTKQVTLPKNVYTHAFMDGSNSSHSGGKNVGYIVVPPDPNVHREFYELYAQCLDAGVVVSISEAAHIRVLEGATAVAYNDVSRVFADFDLKTPRRKSREWKLHVARTWIQALRVCWPDASDLTFRTCVLLRKDVTVKVEQKQVTTTKWKSGMHFIVPNLYATTEQLQQLRSVALQKLREDLPMEDDEPRWSEVYDKECSKALRMIGSQKASRCKKCRGKSDAAQNCAACTGRGIVIDHDAVYYLDAILNADGSANEAANTKLSNNTLSQVLLTHISILAQEATPGFRVPADAAASVAEEVLAHEHGDTKRPLKKSAETVSASSELFEYLQAMARQVHPRYHDMQLKEASAIKDKPTNDIVAYILTPHNASTLPCLNLLGLRAHERQGIYFQVHRKDGIFVQKCLCKCWDKGREHGRVAGPCPAQANRGPVVSKATPQRMLQLFNLTDMVKKRCVRRIQQQITDAAGRCRDPWLSDEIRLYHTLCLRLDGEPPQDSVALPRERALASELSVYLSSNALRSTSIKEREKAMEEMQQSTVLARRMSEIVANLQTITPSDNLKVINRVLNDTSTLFESSQRRAVCDHTEMVRQLYMRRGVGEHCLGMWITPIHDDGTCRLHAARDAHRSAWTTVKLTNEEREVLREVVPAVALMID